MLPYEVAETKVAQVMDRRAGTNTRCNAPWKRTRAHLNALPYAQSGRALQRAVQLAAERKHEYATLEHLLLALIDDEDAAEVMTACKLDIEKLRRDLANYLDNDCASLRRRGRRAGAADRRLPARDPARGDPRPVARPRTKSPAPTCWSRSSPSARATPPTSCRSRT